MKEGVNRLSVGVQTFKDEYLSYLGRNHNRQKALQTIQNLQQELLNEEEKYINNNKTLRSFYVDRGSNQLGKLIKYFF